MGTLKKIVNILVMLYLVVAALIFLDILNVGQSSNPTFYTNFFIAGAALMLLELVVENLYVMSLKRSQGQTQNKINELKASLYDHKQELQEIKTKHAEELAAARAANANAPASYPKAPVQVPPPARSQYNEPIVKPVNSPLDNDLIITPAPIPPAPAAPEYRPTNNPDVDTYREPNR